jgi:hypothetical protein
MTPVRAVPFIALLEQPWIRTMSIALIGAIIRLRSVG